MSASVRDLGCKHNPASEETTTVCEWCESITNFQPKKGWEAFLSPHEHEEAIAQFGGPSLPTRQRWDRLFSSPAAQDLVQWARLDGSIDPVVSLPCSPMAFENLADGIQAGRMMTGEESRWLQNGVRFHDGTTLRYMRDCWFLDDVRLPSLSLEILFPMLADEQARCGWNFSSLILGLATCTPAFNHLFDEGDVRMFRLPNVRGVQNIRGHYRPLASMLIWLINRLQLDRTHEIPSRETVPMMAWAHDIKQRLLRRQPADLHATFQNALSNHPPGLFERYDVPWMRSWLSLEPTHDHPRTLKAAFLTSGGKLKFRVRTKAGNLRLVNVPLRPEAWALAISMTHSPLNSKAGKLLLGLQHNWSVPYTAASEPSAPLVKSLEFCHQIMNGLAGKVSVQHAKALVFGKLGHAYEVRVGNGQHGAPYKIDYLFGLERHSRQSICIHSGSHNNRLPLGDTMGSVLLSLADDVNASLEIPSLSDIIVHSPPFGFPPNNVENAWLDTLDQKALQVLRREIPGSRAWYTDTPRRFVDEEEDENGEGLAGLQLFHHHRRQRRRGARRASQRWVQTFHRRFETDLSLPYDEVVAEWRTTVHPFEPMNAYQGDERGGPFGHFQRMLRRHHRHIGHRRPDDVHEVGDIRDGERRWCEVFARVWEVMSLQPIGSEVRYSRRDGDALTFEHAHLTVTLRNGLERTTMSRIARILGYARNTDEDRQITYVRRDHPRPHARLELTDVLRDAQDRQGVRGAPPRWWNYCDVGAAPAGMGPLRWELEVDLTDQPRQHQRVAPDDGQNWVFLE